MNEQVNLEKSGFLNIFPNILEGFAPHIPESEAKDHLRRSHKGFPVDDEHLLVR